MNKLDMPLQSASWKAEAQALKPNAQSLDGREDGQSVEAFDIFNALLRNLSERSEGAPARTQLPVGEIKTVLPSDGKTDDGVTDESQTGDLLQGPSLDVDALPQPQLPLDNAPFQIDAARSTQPPLPQQVGLTLKSAPTLRDKPVVPASASLLDLIQLSTDKAKQSDNLGIPAALPERKAVVVHQEAHFKPVLMTDAPVAAKPKGAAILYPARTPAPAIESMSAATDSSTQEDALTQKVGAPQIASEKPRPVAIKSNEMDRAAAPDPHALVQKVVGAIEADSTRTALDQNVQLRRHDPAAPATPTKLSDGVLRVLDIQLHPAELGVITVKMRLSGDKLEMELHASRGETAELLKKDSEALSSLLRSSGYRPDVVSVHASRPDASHPDGLFGQRPSANSDPSSNFGSSQGGEAGHNGRSRGDAEEFRNGSQGGQKNGTEEITSANRSPGNLYL
jgi:flagellar hook-length control protein FliK